MTDKCLCRETTDQGQFLRLFEAEAMAARVVEDRQGEILWSLTDDKATAPVLAGVGLLESATVFCR